MRPIRPASVMFAALLFGTAASAQALEAASPDALRAGQAQGAAASDRAADMDFLFRLAMVEGHLIVGHDLLAARQGDLALPHFGHPVRELYDDLSEYLEARKFPAFDTQLLKLEAAAASAPYAAATEAQYTAVIETVHKAREIAPADLRASVPAMITVCAETLDAASGEYNGSLEGGQVKLLVEYHDSRGYVSWVSQYVDSLIAGHKDAASQDLLGRMKTIAGKAQWIVEALLPAPAPRASVDQYRAVAVEAAALSKQ
jgi:hypothetical protein